MRRPRGSLGKKRQREGLDDVVVRRPQVAGNALENHSCLKKKPHSRQDAVFIAGKMAEKYGMAFAVYECQFCRQWHVGKDSDPQE